jgi:hypothetical protein
MTCVLYIALLSVVTAVGGCGGYTYSKTTDAETGSTSTTIRPRKASVAGCHLLTLSPGLQRIVGSYSVLEGCSHIWVGSRGVERRRLSGTGRRESL